MGGRSMIPELDEVDSQMWLALNPDQRPVVQKALDDALARLRTIDRTDLPQYASALQQVVMLQRRLASNVTYESLMAQRVEILEKLI